MVPTSINVNYSKVICKENTTKELTLEILSNNKIKFSIIVEKNIVSQYHIHIRMPDAGVFYFINASADVMQDMPDGTMVCLETSSVAFIGTISVAFKSIKNEFIELAEINTKDWTIDQANTEVFVKILFKDGIVSDIPCDSLKLLAKNICRYNSNWTIARKYDYYETQGTFCPADHIPIPDSENMVRILGRAIPPDVFIDSGRAMLGRILSIYNAFQDDIFSVKNVMDWGVGCGRLARHLPKNWRNGFYGVDVDPVNVEWCRNNFSFGKFTTINPHHKNRIVNESFDLIYSVSVMTHLRRDDQLFWLRKLSEICNPKGLMIISIHGLHHACRLGWASNPLEFSKFMKNGMVGGNNQNNDISDVTPPLYYTDVANTPEDIYLNWSRYVQILDVIPGGIDEHDAVVMQPLKS